MDFAVIFAAAAGMASGGATVAYYFWLGRSRPDPNAAAVFEPVAPGAAASSTVSLDGLVQHYLATGITGQRTDDALPFDQPLAPEAPQPSAVSLSDLVARLPVVSREEGSAGE